MDVAELSIVMSQSSAQQSSGIVAMKMDTGKETASQMTEMMKNVAADPNLGNHIDVSL